MNDTNASPLPRRRAIALAGIAAIGLGLGLAGCGDSSSPASSADTTATASATTGTSASMGQDTAGDATAAVSDAYATLQKSSYTSTDTTTQTLDASGVDESVRADVEAKMSDSLADSTSQMTVESPDRREVKTETKGKTSYVVLYDGQMFVSPDGTTWAQFTGKGAQALMSTAQLASVNPSSMFTNLQAAGTADVGGQPGTAYTGDISADKATSLVNGAFGVLGGEFAKVLGDALTVKGGTVKVVVDDATGNIASQDISYEFAFDLGALAGAAGATDSSAAGSIAVTTSSKEVVTDVGDNITVEKPAATKKVSDIVQLGLFLAG